MRERARNHGAYLQLQLAIADDSAAPLFLPPSRGSTQPGHEPPHWVGVPILEVPGWAILVLVTSDPIPACVEENAAPVAGDLLEVVDGDDVPPALVLACKRHVVACEAAQWVPAVDLLVDNDSGLALTGAEASLLSELVLALVVIFLILRIVGLFLVVRRRRCRRPSARQRYRLDNKLTYGVVHPVGGRC